MGKARNLSVLLAADGQVEDAKIDGVSSSKLSGALPAISAENLTSIPAGELTGTISDSRLSTASQVAKLPLSGGTMTGNIVMGDDTSIGIGDSAERIEFDGAGDIGFLGCNVGISRSNPDARLELTSNSNGGILIKHSEQIAYTPSSLGNFRQGITFENSGSSHAFSIGYGQGAKIKFSYYDGSSTFSEIASIDSLGNIAVTGTVDGRDVGVDGTKLDGIEANATADQTGAQIKTAYEAESDTNALTDTLKTKLDGIATSANNYSHPTGAGNKHIPSGGSTDQVLTYSSSGTATWEDATGGGASNTTSHGLYEMANTISANYSITSGNNALTAGPITVASGVSVTIPSGSTWVIA